MNRGIIIVLTKRGKPVISYIYYPVISYIYYPNFYAVINARRESETKTEALYEEPGELLKQVQQVPL